MWSSSMRALLWSFVIIFLPSHGSISHAEWVDLPLDLVPGVILINKGVVVNFLNIFLPSHKSLSHAEEVGLPLDPVPGVILINEGVVVKLLDHILTFSWIHFSCRGSRSPSWPGSRCDPHQRGRCSQASWTYWSCKKGGNFLYSLTITSRGAVTVNIG